MESRQFVVSCTETPDAVPKTVPCLAQVEGGPAPLGSGGGSVPPDATLRAFASHCAASSSSSSSTQSGLPRNHSKPPDEAEPLDIDAVMAERSRVLRGVASGELDPEAMHASNRSLARALSRLAPQ